MKHTKFLLSICSTLLTHNGFATEQDVLKDIAIGSAAAVVEVMVDQPLVYLKNMAQQNKAASTQVESLWKGAPANAAGLAPVTAIQIVTYNEMLKHLEKNNIELNASAKMAAAFSAGVLSGLASGPSENIMLLQQNTKAKFPAAAKKIFSTHGIRGMYRGLLPTMIRDGGFSAGFLGLRPIIKKKLEPSITNQTSLNLICGISSGIVASIATHPSDTIKTVMQADLDNKECASSIKTLLKIVKEEKARGLFKGLTARSARVASAITVMGFVTDQLNGILKNKK